MWPIRTHVDLRFPMQNEQQPGEQFLDHGPTCWSAASGLLGAAIGSLHLCVSGLGASSKISIWGSTMGGTSGVPPGFIAGFVWGSNGTSWVGGWPNCNRFPRPFPAPFKRSTGSAQRTDSQSEPACNCPSGFTSIFLSGDGMQTTAHLETQVTVPREVHGTVHPEEQKLFVAQKNI